MHLVHGLSHWGWRWVVSCDIVEPGCDFIRIWTLQKITLLSKHITIAWHGLSQLIHHESGAQMMFECHLCPQLSFSFIFFYQPSLDSLPSPSTAQKMCKICHIVQAYSMLFSVFCSFCSFFLLQHHLVQCTFTLSSPNSMSKHIVLAPGMFFFWLVVSFF